MIVRILALALTSHWTKRAMTLNKIEACILLTDLDGPLTTETFSYDYQVKEAHRWKSKIENISSIISSFQNRIALIQFSIWKRSSEDKMIKT